MKYPSEPALQKSDGQEKNQLQCSARETSFFSITPKISQLPQPFSLAGQLICISFSPTIGFALFPTLLLLPFFCLVNITLCVHLRSAALSEQLHFISLVQDSPPKFSINEHFCLFHIYVLAAKIQEYRKRSLSVSLHGLDNLYFLQHLEKKQLEQPRRLEV